MVQQDVPVFAVGDVAGLHPDDVGDHGGRVDLLGEHEVARVDQPKVVVDPVLHAGGFDDVDGGPVLGVGPQSDDEQRDDGQRHERLEPDRIAGPPVDRPLGRPSQPFATGSSSSSPSVDQDRTGSGRPR